MTTLNFADIDLSKVDLTDLSYFEDGPPYPLFARLRSEASPHWNALTGDEPGFWSFTKAADIAAISRNPQRSRLLAAECLRPLRVQCLRRYWDRSYSAWTRLTRNNVTSCRLFSRPS